MSDSLLGIPIEPTEQSSIGDVFFLDYNILKDESFLSVYFETLDDFVLRGQGREDIEVRGILGSVRRANTDSLNEGIAFGL